MMNFPEHDMAILVDDEDLFLRMEFKRRRAYLHVDILRRPIASIRRLIGLRPSLSHILRALGYDRVYARCQRSNFKLHKFCRLMGFSACGANQEWFLLRVVLNKG
ncbi:MAG: hypothetical protein A3E01_08195 [Gammaproteobacteria bacterium RIFCSPHIGHO2_12_FULL_63_22]|nr:MAG: hypothetical protein A3E01_08195 [Gammaproteobacteria bacterium RIFCSPHIGHO2_12_FULL_63_22]